MKFDPKPIIADLQRNKEIISSLLTGITEKEYLFRENSEKWNLLEVICHLLDEEREDFKVRINSVLQDPTKKLPPIDPVGWVNSRKYQEQNYNHNLKKWVKEREKGVKWLDSLVGVAWDNAFQHQHFGPMSAKLFLCNWLSHDYHHIRQIITIRRAFIMHTTGETLDYAGQW